MPTGYQWPRSVRWELFDMVCAGVPIRQAKNILGVAKNTAYDWWRDAGGMTLHTGSTGGPVITGKLNAPGGRGHRLNLDERISIQHGLDTGMSITDIGAMLGRNKSVISRELSRNRNPDGDYHAGLAHARAAMRALRPKPFVLLGHPLCRVIEEWMDQGWSPKLISEYLRKQFPDDPNLHISHETIYQALYSEERGSLRSDLHQKLKTKRKTRKPRDREDLRGQKFRDAKTIRDRPPEVADRLEPGHWEGDLIVGAMSGSAIGTLVERTTRSTLLLHLPAGDHGAAAVTAAIIAAMKNLPAHLRRSITWDQGSEFVRHKDIAATLDLDTYVCDPHSPWQRGTNENTNGLLRFWFEKGTDLSVHAKADLRRVQQILNNRPRRVLDLETPASRLAGLMEPVAA